MTDAHGVARDQLRAFVERIERLEEEKKTIADDIKDVYGEAKGMGYDTKIMKKVISLRKIDDQQRTEEDLVLDTYLAALGMIEAPFEQDDEPVAVAPTRSPAKPLQAPRTATTVSARVAINQPETANETVGGFPVAAAPTSAEETGAIQSTRQGAGVERGMNPSVTGGESAATNSEMDRATEGSLETGSEAAEKGRKAIPAGPEGVDLNHAGAGGSPAASCEYCDGTGDVHRIDGEWLGYCHCDDGQRLKGSPVSEIAPASHGEAEAPSVEREPPVTEPALHRFDANTGGDHEEVAQHQYAATHQAGASFKAPATFSLRPDCRNPGETCAGHGTTLCHSCKVAMRERELT